MRDFRGKITLRQRANKLSLITIFLWSLVTELHTGIFLLQTFFKIYGLKTVAEDASYLLATGQMGLLGHGTCFPWSQPQGVLGLPFSSLQILALLLGAIGLILGLKLLKTDSGLPAAACPESRGSHRDLWPGNPNWALDSFRPNEDWRVRLEDFPGYKVPALPANPFRNRAGTFHLYLFV